MGAKIDGDKISRIVTMSALDYEKQEIADEVDVSRNTVRNHLQRIREFAEREGKNEAAVVASYVLMSSNEEDE